MKQDITIKKGPITLSPNPTSKFASYSHGRPSEAQFNILVSLKDCDDV